MNIYIYIHTYKAAYFLSELFFGTKSGRSPAEMFIFTVPAELQPELGETN